MTSTNATSLVSVALLTAALLPAHLTAQEATPPDPTEPKAAQVDIVEQLKAQLAKIEAELKFLEDLRARGGVLALVKGHMKDRTLDPRSIPDPSPPRAQPAEATLPKIDNVQTGVVRLLGDEEKERLGSDVVFTVDSVPVTNQEFAETFDYLKSYMHQLPDEELERQAILELVVNRAAEAHYADAAKEARAHIADAKRRLDGGEDFATVAREMSHCPSAESGGSLGEIGRVGMDLMFAKAAFGLNTGETSDIVQTAFGFHLIKIDGREKGAERSADKVTASHILASFDKDSNAARQVMFDARLGKVELAFASDNWRKKSPF